MFHFLLYSNWALLHWATCVRVFFFLAFGCKMSYCYMFCVLYCVISWKMENLCQTVSSLTSPIILTNKIKYNWMSDVQCLVHPSGLWMCILYASVFNCNHKSAHLMLFISLWSHWNWGKTICFSCNQIGQNADANCFSYLWFDHNNVLCSSVSDDIVSFRNFICFAISISQMSRKLIQNRKDKNGYSVRYLLHV